MVVASMKWNPDDADYLLTACNPVSTSPSQPRVHPQIHPQLSYSGNTGDMMERKRTWCAGSEVSWSASEDDDLF